MARIQLLMTFGISTPVVCKEEKKIENVDCFKFYNFTVNQHVSAALQTQSSE